MNNKSYVVVAYYGDKVKKFYSVEEAAAWFRTTVKHVENCMKTGYLWRGVRYAGINQIKVIAFESDKIINYDTIQEAADHYNVTVKQILYCIKSGHSLHGVRYDEVT